MQYYDILIATPGAMMEAQYVKSLVNSLAECDKRGLTYRFISGSGSLVHHARELTVSGGEGLELNPNHKGPIGDSVTYNKIFWIDSDISWNPKDFVRIYQSDKDITSGIYVNNKGLPMFTQLESELNIDVLAMCQYEEKFEVAAAGFGFISIKSGIHENMQRPWFESIYQEIENENKTKKMKIPFGEDYSWCYRARFQGYKIYVDPKVKVTHNKKIPLTPK